jgi:hypothetical protein
VAFGLGAALYAPLEGGLLTGKYRVSSEGRLSRWGAGVHTEDSERTTAVLDGVLGLLGGGLPGGLSRATFLQLAMVRLVPWPQSVLHQSITTRGASLCPGCHPRGYAQPPGR